MSVNCPVGQLACWSSTLAAFTLQKASTAEKEFSHSQDVPELSWQTQTPDIRLFVLHRFNLNYCNSEMLHEGAL